MYLSLKNRILADPGLYVLLFMVLIYPLIVIPGPMDNFRGPRYFILAIVSAVAFYIVFSKGRLKYHPAYIPLGLFFLFSFISTLLADDVLQAIFGYFYSGFSTYVFCLFLFFLAINCRQTDKVLKYIIVGAALVSVTAVLQHFGLNIVPLDEYRDPSQIFGTIGNANWLATLMVFTLPAAVLSHKLFTRNAWLACTACIYAGVLVSNTRFAWMSFFVTFVLMAVYLRKTPESRKILLNVILVFVMVTAILLPTRDWAILNRGLSIYDEVSLAVELDGRAGSGRMNLWREAAGVISENWAFGVGLDGFKITDLTKAHNIYLEMGATVGVFALVSYLVFLSYFLRRWKNEKGFIFFCMIFTYLLQGFFIHDVIMVMPIFWIVLGMYLSNQQGFVVELAETRERKSNRIINLLVFAISVFVIIAALCLLFLAWGHI